MIAFLRAAPAAAFHPAALFSAGNTALILGQAEPLAIIVNASLTAIIYIARLIEVVTKRTLGVPFVILSGINFFTAVSIEFNRAMDGESARLFTEGFSALANFNVANLASTEPVVLAAHMSALALVLWGFGGLYAGKHDKQGTTAKNARENPQMYYGLGDMVAVNASGSINPFSFPFMALGFIKSMLIGQKPAGSKRWLFFQKEFTAARIYGAGYIIGAITTLALPAFAIAQALWAIGYFSFKKDT